MYLITLSVSESIFASDPDYMYGGLYSRKSFIYKYETSTLTPFVKPSDKLNLDVRNVIYVQLYMESDFTYNPARPIFVIALLYIMCRFRHHRIFSFGFILEPSRFAAKSFITFNAGFSST